MEHRHHDLGRADALGVHADRDAAAVVFDRDRAVEVDDDLDALAVARQVLVDAVVDRFPHQVVQARAIVDVADVHARAFANRLEALENRDVLGTVRLGAGRGADRLVASVIRMVSVQPRSGCTVVAADWRAPPAVWRRSSPARVSRRCHRGPWPEWRGEEIGSEGPPSDARILAFLRPLRKECPGRLIFPCDFGSSKALCFRAAFRRRTLAFSRASPGAARGTARQRPRSDGVDVARGRAHCGVR